VRRGPLIAVIVLVTAATVGVLLQRPWDRRISAEKAERLLEARLANGVPYRCSGVEQDGTVGDGEMDVDYFCGPERPADRINETGYWFGTDSDGISTELVGAG
jgi:hypothetical protein